MSMWYGLRRWMFEKELRKKTFPHKSLSRSMVNPAQRIGILFDGTLEDERKILHRFKKELTAAGKEVQSLAFINNNLPLDNVDYAAYNLRNVNWYGIPSGEKVEQFMAREFDILLPLIRKMEMHFEYIFAGSNAKMIIGPSVPHAERYFRIISEQSEETNLQLLIKELMSNIHKITQ